MLPCHIWCFVVLDGLKGGRNAPNFGGIRLENGTFGVVETGQYDNQSDDKKDKEEWKRSEILKPFLKQIGSIDKDGNVVEREFFLADTSAFVSPLAVVPDLGGPQNRWFVMKPRSEWVELFEKWANWPHYCDEMDPILPPPAPQKKKKSKKRAKTVEDAAEERDYQ